jgi:hypothetical protein
MSRSSRFGTVPGIRSRSRNVRRSAARRLGRLPLCVEALESRLVPSTVSVQGAAAGRLIDAPPLGVNLTFYDYNLNTPETANLVKASGLSLFRISNGSGTEGDLHFDQPENERPGYAPRPLSAALQAVQDFNGTALVTVNYGSGSPQEGLAYLAYLNGQVGDMTAIGFGPQPGDPLFTTNYTAKDWQTVDFWARLRSEAPFNDGSREDALRINHPQPFHFKYWEIANEQYFGPEYGPDGMAVDNHSYPGGASPANRAQLYVTFAKQFSDAAHAIDPTVSVGVDVGNPDVNDPNQLIAQWTKYVLLSSQAEGFTPGFLSDHIYVFGDQVVDDATVLHSVDAPHPELTLDKGQTDWVTRAAAYRDDLNVLGAAGASVELLATEMNSYPSSNSKQMTSLVNGLWYADSIGSILQTDYHEALFWDLRNAYQTFAPNGNLYGWRDGGDEGLLGSPQGGNGTADTPAMAGGPSQNDGANVRYPSYFAAALASHFVHAGDRIVPATVGNDDPNLTAYAVKQANGHLALLLINKEPPADPNQPAQTKSVSFQVAGFVPTTTAQSWQYGKAEDDQQKNTGTSDITADPNVPLQVNNLGGMANFSIDLPAYSMTVLDLAPDGGGQQPPPVISTVAPHSGKPGDTINIAGSGFMGTTVVHFGAVAVTTFTVLSDGEISATVPNADPGTSVEITVTTPNGDSALTATDHFVYQGAPTHPGQFAFDVAARTVAESDGVVTVAVDRTNGSDGTVTVHFATSDGSAQAGVDYAAADATLTFAPGETQHDIAIRLLNDGQIKPQQTFMISLTSVDAGSIVAPSRVVVTIDNSNATDSEKYVSQVYHDLLARGVNGDGLAYWSNLLDSGVDRSIVARELSHSPEYYQTNVIVPAYRQFLNRAADQGGLDYWTAQLQGGLTDEKMQAEFLASDEFYAMANNSNADVPPTPANDCRWVDALYQSLLGRAPDQEGEDFWTDQLQGNQARAQVANGFTGSTEGLTDRVQQTYQRYLGRGADAGGLAFWLSQYGNGAVNEDIVTGFIGSDEYFRGATA